MFDEKQKWPIKTNIVFWFIRLYAANCGAISIASGVFQVNSREREREKKYVVCLAASTSSFLIYPQLRPPPFTHLNTYLLSVYFSAVFSIVMNHFRWICNNFFFNFFRKFFFPPQSPRIERRVKRKKKNRRHRWIDR